ncbi:MAG TPA: glycosyl hydrolase family 39 [Candidatus Binatia bacterium]|nr:glycosyl hydrolase family 39 [Candidatus Binatia bacterium]
MRNPIFLLTVLVFCALPLASQTSVETITIDAAAPAHPFPHFWEQMFGSGRAILSLRDSYRRDLAAVRDITGFQYIRFHAILDDDVGVYDEDKHGQPVYNFSYVDQIYDGLLAAHVKPFVELSFMPYKLAAQQHLQAFWYHPNVSPPKDYALWDELIGHFVRHIVERYGIDEVASWYFEVWNEPNLDFWTGAPREKSYFELYDHTARDIKAVSPRLRVGGPATAQAAWVADMIRHADQAHVPLDFVSTHVYGNDTASDVFGSSENISRDRMVCRAVKKVHEEIRASTRPEMPLIWSEFNAAYDNEVAVTDSIYMGPWLASTIAQCDGLAAMMSYWTFSDVFEEQGVVRTPFYGGFGLIAAGNIPKPSFYAMQALHALGDRRIENTNGDVLVTKARDGSLVVAVWNLANPGTTGSAKSIKLYFKGVAPAAGVSIRRIDETHGNTLGLWERMGSPRYPTEAQLNELRRNSQLPAAESTHLSGGSLTLQLPINGLAVLQVR